MAARQDASAGLRTQRGTTDRSSLTERLRQSRERRSGGVSSAPNSGDRQATTRFGDTGSAASRRDDSRRGTIGDPSSRSLPRSSESTRSGLRDRLDSTGSHSTFGTRVGPSRGVPAARQETDLQTARIEARHQSLGSRLLEHRQRTHTESLASPYRDSGTRLGVGVRTDLGTRRPLYLHARYYDRPDLIRHTDRHIQMYYDPYNHLRHRIIWPSYYYPVYYSFGPSWRFDYVWPYYHRKYVFVSLGGWWPSDYTYMRYYWYGYHPYLWYGYYPVAREVEVGGDSYYYTYNYNYYGSEDAGYTTYDTTDPVTQARLQAQMEQQKAAEPAAQTLADTRFDEGVKSFEAGNYTAAAAQFAQAASLAPQDVILPFAYAQALFADGQYDPAAAVLRQALKNVTPEKEGVFFPRGLYANDDVLFGQIDKLLDRADQNADNGNLDLLLGYQLLGVGETGYARDQLEQAQQDPQNAEAAAILLKLVEKVEKEAAPAVQTGGAAAQVPADTPAPQVRTVPSTGVTIGKMMSTAPAGAATGAAPMVGPVAPPESTPPAPAATIAPAPAGIVPAPAPQDQTGTPAQEPKAEPEGSGAVDESNVTPPQGAAPAQSDKDGWVGAAHQDSHGAAVETAGFLESTAGVNVLSGLRHLGGERAPNYKADMVIFGTILSLALAGLWVEWRVLGRKPV